MCNLGCSAPRSDHRSATTMMPKTLYLLTSKHGKSSSTFFRTLFCNQIYLRFCIHHPPSQLGPHIVWRLFLTLTKFSILFLILEPSISSPVQSFPLCYPYFSNLLNPPFNFMNNTSNTPFVCLPQFNQVDVLWQRLYTLVAHSIFIMIYCLNIREETDSLGYGPQNTFQWQKNIKYHTLFKALNI